MVQVFIGVDSLQEVGDESPAVEQREERAGRDAAGKGKSLETQRRRDEGGPPPPHSEEHRASGMLPQLLFGFLTTYLKDFKPLNVK